jgi:DNA-binding MarR family transcriptional regulator
MTDTDTRPERDPDADLRPSDRLILRVLREAEGSIPTKTLIRRSGLAQSTVSTRTAVLADAGYIERQHDTDAPGRLLYTI